MQQNITRSVTLPRLDAALLMNILVAGTRFVISRPVPSQTLDRDIFYYHHRPLNLCLTPFVPVRPWFLCSSSGEEHGVSGGSRLGCVLLVRVDAGRLGESPTTPVLHVVPASALVMRRSTFVFCNLYSSVTEQ